MIEVKMSKGASIPLATGLRRISVDEKEAAAAAIDGWQLLLSGGEKFVRADGSLLNRVNTGVPVTSLGSNNPSVAVIPGTSHVALATPLSGSVSDHDPGFEMNTDAFTFFAVMYLPAGTGPDQLIIPDPIPADDTFAPRIGFNGSGAFRIWRGDTTVLLSHGTGAADYYDQLVYVMASGSTANGLTLRRNGITVATTESFAGFGATGFHLFKDFNGYIAQLGILSNDLAAPKYTSERAALDSWFMGKYAL